MSTDERLYVLTVEAEDVLTIDEDGQDGVVGASWVSVRRRSLS